MSKGLKITLIIFAIILIAVIGFYVYVLAVTASAKLDESKLINFNKTVTYFDINGDKVNDTEGANDKTPIQDIPEHVVNAFVAIEDKRFYSHKGVDYKGLVRALFNNIKSFSFKEGASTISQQLIKNTHLSSEKTLNRKFIEMKLAKDLEKKYSKSEIMEKYLNTIYFGDNCFGITKASLHYFNKPVNQLSLNEGAILAGLIKAPSTYSPTSNESRCNTRKNTVLKEMFEQGLINQNDYNVAKSQNILTDNIQQTGKYNFFNLARHDLNEIIEKNVYFGDHFDVYTTYRSDFQHILESIINEKTTNNFLYKVLIMDKNSNILAYTANCTDSRRQIGSTIKPLLCFAPAIEENVVDSFTIINDEKTDFGGYSPSNYNDVYSGNISVKKALIKSSNVCAVKLLNYVGINKAKHYLSRTNVPIIETDNTYGIALGATQKGATLRELLSSYSLFMNGGTMHNYGTIDKISGLIGRNTSKPYKSIRKIFNEDTTHIINDMLYDTVNYGTAKKLSFTNIPLCAKTGTVGTDKGNTDAYSVSYNKDYIIGVWIGNKDNSMLPNSITGGGLPSEIAKDVWCKIYNDTTDYPDAFDKSELVENIKIDRLSYENQKIEISDINAPERFSLDVLVKKSRLPKIISKRFSSPIIDTPKLSVNYNEITIELCQTEFYNVKVFRVFRNKKELIYDTRFNKNKTLIKDTPKITGEYVYSVVPYYYNGQQELLGNEIFLPKIKIYSKQLDGDWWQENYQ